MKSVRVLTEEETGALGGEMYQRHGSQHVPHFCYLDPSVKWFVFVLLTPHKPWHHMALEAARAALHADGFNEVVKLSQGWFAIVADMRSESIFFTLDGYEERLAFAEEFACAL